MGYEYADAQNISVRVLLNQFSKNFEYFDKNCYEKTLKYFDNKCPYTGEEITTSNCEKDHIVFEVKRLEHDFRPLCCNVSEKFNIKNYLYPKSIPYPKKRSIPKNALKNFLLLLEIKRPVWVNNE